MKKNLLLLSMVAGVIISSFSAIAQCYTAPYGQWPSSTYTPTCNGAFGNITTNGWAGEYSVVSLTAGVNYTFKSSVSTDYITVDNNGAAPLVGTFGVSGVNGISWTCTATGTYRFYTHTNTSCGVSTASRTRSIRCSTPAPPAPANDLCANATPLPCGTSGLAGTTVGTTTTGDANAYSSSYGVWYTFVGNGQNTTITSVAGSGYDHEMTIYSGSCASKTFIATRDVGFSGGTETYSFATTNGTTYLVYIAHWSTSSATTGTFTMSRTCTAPPANPCTSATALTCGTSSDFSVASGTGSWSGYGPFGTPGIEKVYTFTPSFTGSYEVTVDNNGPSTWVDLFYGTACGQSSMTYLNDPWVGVADGETSTVSLVAGTTYYFVLDPESTSGYSGSISIVQSLAAPVISGTANFCGNGSFIGNTYSIAPVSGATSYTWSVPTGAGMSLQGGGSNQTYTGTATSRNINLNGSFQSGTLTVTANGACGSSTSTYNIQRVGGGDFQITSVPYTNSSSTAGAGNDWDFGRTSQDHIYSWTPSCSGSYTVSLCGSSYDTYLQVISDICAGSPSVLAFNDDACGLSSQLTYNFTAGTTYYILVEGFSSSSAGAYTLNVTPNADGNASIAGTTSICGPGATTATYTVSGADAGTTYSWSLPAGMTANGATNGASINVNVDASFNSGSVTANLTSACGSTSSLSISVARSVEDATYSNEFSHSGNTSGASNSSSLRPSADNIIKWDVTCSGSYNISLCGSGFDTYVYLTDALPCNGGTVLALNDDFCGLQSQLSANVAPGTYYIIVEAWSATGAGAYTLNVTGADLSATFSSSDYNGYGVSCFESNDGSINISATGGSGIEYSIDGGLSWQSSGSFSGLSAGTYEALVRQCLGDVISETVVLVEPTKVNISASNSEILCNGDLSDVTVSTWGGVAPYSTDDAGSYSVPAGDYTYNVVDANGCSASTTLSISEPTVLTVNAGGDETTFFGYGPMECADLSAVGSGGTPGYSYTWTSNVSGGAVGSDVTVCPETNEVYVVTVVDANGCSASDQLSICVINVECEAGNSGNMKVEMCQIPPGNPNNAHTICIDASAVPAHLAIGCTLGACGELDNCNYLSGMAVQQNLLKGLELSTEMALTAYPNPTRTATTISLTSVAKGDYTVVMTDMTGRVIETIYNGFMSDFENMTFDVDMSSLTSGIYLVNVLGNNGITNNLKIVKE